MVVRIELQRTELKMNLNIKCCNDIGTIALWPIEMMRTRDEDLDN